MYMSAAGLNGATDDRKINILLKLIGEDAIEVKQTFEYEKKEDETNFDVILVQQHNGEPFECFLLKLKMRPATCEFGSLRDSSIRDRIVSGIFDKKTQKALLRTNDISLSEAIDFCVIQELSEEQARVLQDSLKVEQIRSTTKTKSMAVNSSNDCHTTHEYLGFF
ncbi:uncharacterized protein isoform X2 [Leptinotarsa decemlineata]|uniref:uncharacterized protein isoform X2 n=1 Tax=Leptinotarsa decemlineata TaxID=7539 RepID=UPI003D306D67